jgi:hypothetical protein
MRTAVPGLHGTALLEFAIARRLLFRFESVFDLENGKVQVKVVHVGNVNAELAAQLRPRHGPNGAHVVDEVVSVVAERMAWRAPRLAKPKCNEWSGTDQPL